VFLGALSVAPSVLGLCSSVFAWRHVCCLQWEGHRPNRQHSVVPHRGGSWFPGVGNATVGPSFAVFSSSYAPGEWVLSPCCAPGGHAGQRVTCGGASTPVSTAPAPLSRFRREGTSRWARLLASPEPAAGSVVSSGFSDFAVLPRGWSPSGCLLFLLTLPHRPDGRTTTGPLYKPASAAETLGGCPLGAWLYSV